MSADNSFECGDKSSMFGDSDVEDETNSSSASTDEEDTCVDEEPSRQPESEVWTATGLQEEFTFTNIHIKLDLAGTPIDFFDLFFNTTFMSKLVSSINAHASQIKLESNSLPHSRCQAWKDTNPDEMRVFIALLFHMGHIQLHNINDYWKTDILFSLPFKQFMSRDRFLIILRNVNLADTDSYDYTDPSRFAKPIITFFNDLMKTLVVPTKNLTINENVLWQTCLRISQNTKRDEYRVKMYELTDSNCITHRILMYFGSNDLYMQDKSHGEKVVMMLMQDFLNTGHSLYMDKFYSSVTLAETLLDKLTYITSTLKVNRFRNPAMTRAKLTRGKSLARYNSRGVCVTNYRDKKSILMISTEHQSNLIEYKNKRGNISQKPKVIVEYNKYMSGVNKKLNMLSYHPIYNKSTRWDKKIIFHVMQIMILNAYIMFNEYTKKSMSYLDFRLNVIKKLLNVDRASNKQIKNKITPIQSSISTAKMRAISGDEIHLPAELPKNDKGRTKRKDCKQCLNIKNIRKATLFYCALCEKKPGLCLKCFRQYHNY